MNHDDFIGILQILDDGAYVVDADRRIMFWNSSAERITGFSASEVTGFRCRDNILQHVAENGNQLCLDGCPLLGTISDCRPRQTDVFLHHKNGHRLPVSVRAAPMKDDSGAVTGAIEIFSEKSEPSRLLDELEALRNEILIDKQTGLGNRRYMEIVQAARISALERSAGRLGLLFLDIDHFKNVNDTWGHTIGDRVLKMVGMTLKGAIRPIDSAIRYGGEEFVVLLPDCDAARLAAIAERVRALVEMAWLDEGGTKIGATVSIGGTLMQAGDDFGERLAKADALMYECKNSGRNRVRIEN